MLSKLLGAEEPTFSMSIKQLERVSGSPSMDVRLMSEIIQKVRQKVEELDLDPTDTTGEELYYMLLGKIKAHDQHLARHIGGKDPSEVHSMQPVIKRTLEKYLNNSSSGSEAWVLKKSVAKRLLHQMPPDKVMKVLGYTSVESLTKRENLAEIFSALRFAQSPAWLKKFNKLYKHLMPSDFENRRIEVVLIDKDKWSSLPKFTNNKAYNITHLKELGVVALLPPFHNKIEGFTIATLPIALHYINEIRLYSAFFKMQQVKPDFGKIITSTLNEDVTSNAEMAGSQIHWRIVQRHYGRPEHLDHPEIFQPHIQPEDLYWRRAEEQLYEIDPELNFWRGLDYVGASIGEAKPVSFNLMDLSMSYYLACDYSDRIVAHMRASLWNELYMRYMGQKVLESQVLQQLGSNMISPKQTII